MDNMMLQWLGSVESGPLAPLTATFGQFNHISISAAHVWRHGAAIIHEEEMQNRI